jgi:hypothetical protein
MYAEYRLLFRGMENNTPPPIGPSDSALLERIRRAHLRQQAEDEALRLRHEWFTRMEELMRRGHVESVVGIDMQAQTATADDVPELVDRHKQLNIAKALLQAAEQKQAGNPSLVAALRRQLTEAGGFLQDENEGYDYDSLMARVMSPLWVVSHARGSIVDPQTKLIRPSVWAADIQIELAADDATEPVSFVPAATDKGLFFDHQRELALRIADEIRQTPSIAACISDVGVAPFQPDRQTGDPVYKPEEYQRKRFASVARRHAVERIRTAINPTRKHRIRYLLANMFSIPGVVLADGREVTFEEPMRNEVSILMHAASQNYRSLLGWESPSSEVEVPGGGKIKSGWLTGVLVVPE